MKPLALAFILALLPAAALPAAPESPETAKETVARIRRLFTQGQWREAVAALREAEQAMPQSEDLRFMSAMVAMDEGDYAESLRLYSQLLEKYPENAELKNNIAWLRVMAKEPPVRDLDLALKLAQEAALQADHNYNIWNTLGEIYLARGDAMKAMRFAVLARDLAAMAGERDLRMYHDLVSRCEAAGR